MLITDKFVLINLPKTGSTFARTVIKEIYNQRYWEKYWIIRKITKIVGIKNLQSLHKLFYYKHLKKQSKLAIFENPLYKEIMMPNIRITGAITLLDQHGTYSEVPEAYRDRQIVSIVRNPYDRLLSLYNFQWWKYNPPLKKELLFRYFPNFPNLSIDDYICLMDYVLVDQGIKAKNSNICVGGQTIQFIKFFFKNPDQVIQNLDEQYLNADQVFEDMAPIKFLRQEFLKEDLARFLESLKFKNKEIVYIRMREKVNITKKTYLNRDCLTPSAISYVREKEKLIFRILETYGITYKEPKIS